MKRLLIGAVALAGVASLSGCLTASQFLGSDDPCQQAEVAYDGYRIFAATQNVPADWQRYAESGIAAVRAQCSDGNINNVTLRKAVDAYVAALQTYRGQ